MQVGLRVKVGLRFWGWFSAIGVGYPVANTSFMNARQRISCSSLMSIVYLQLHH